MFRFDFHRYSTASMEVCERVPVPLKKKNDKRSIQRHTHAHARTHARVGVSSNGGSSGKLSGNNR